MDPNVLGLFEKASAIERLVIVNGTKEAGDKLFSILCSVNDRFGSTHLWRSKPLIFGGGFRAFMESTDFENLISS